MSIISYQSKREKEPYSIGPLSQSHPFVTLDNVLATPHLGYVSPDLYKTFYEDTVANIRKWLDSR